MTLYRVSPYKRIPKKSLPNFSKDFLFFNLLIRDNPILLTPVPEEGITGGTNRQC
jgi:hypothetical protein